MLFGWKELLEAMLNESILSRGHVLQRNIGREIKFVSLIEILGSREEVRDSEDGLTGKNEGLKNSILCPTAKRVSHPMNRPGDK